MRVFNAGDVTYGKSHVDMINKAIGTNYFAWQKATVDLEQFGVPDVIAWFVFMDGSEHGYEEGWRWKNYLSENGEEICEYNVSPSKMAVIAKRNEDGYYPYRLCFRLDPYENGNRHCCRFVGAFTFEKFIKEDLTAIKYKKIADEFRIGSKGESGCHLSSKADFIQKESHHLQSIGELGFSDRVYRLLKNGGIIYAGELLELGLGITGEIAEEIQQKLYQYFCDK